MKEFFKKYFLILGCSLIPFVPFIIVWIEIWIGRMRLLYDLLGGFGGIAYWFIASAWTIGIIVVGTINLEQNTKKRVLLILLMPTLYVFILSIVLMAIILISFSLEPLPGLGF